MISDVRTGVASKIKRCVVEHYGEGVMDNV